MNSLQMLRRGSFAVILLLFAAICVARAAVRWIPTPEKIWITPESEWDIARTFVETPASEHHKALRETMDFPGTTAVKLHEASETKVPDETVVIGIVVNGQAYAFARDALLFPNHILNLTFDQTPISVTYCDLADCARVLTSDKPASDAPVKPIDLRIGGLDVDDQMVFLLEGTRYGQSTKTLPLKDHPFKVTTWAKWRQQHPRTRVHTGDSLARS